ncbi:MAG: hypothetical protein G01um101418_104 [Parcubacteria group bacterium Gr01-1014_18]|nr:MAG: hypothetical protein Greene041636_408 [Parcubacteria group bacterium Greene0416_36]TSC81431.1 MAG: hypothetical protein G01um101418_104 [Parcubacteria group bacterium Gr01-1014_18]TSC99029.1 MAG: hypothetical protein Greene101420_385 [Parcubacteria group bacterium Greene1014_20]TSD07290.1 MAG: hypothetical protein Greene07142_306 [Parcubacteria group bacterium Greene0714_2]
MDRTRLILATLGGVLVLGLGGWLIWSRMATPTPEDNISANPAADSIELALPASDPVYVLPDFARTECEKNKGTIVSITEENGKKREKCQLE